MIVKGFEVEGVIKVDNVRVYGIEESIIASGYPMQTKTVPMVDNAPVTNLVISDKDMKRAKHLGNAVPGSGHDCFAKGVTVQFDLQVPEYIWRQLDRYHFIDYVSSQSKMHRILKMDIDKACNKYVLESTKTNLKSLIDLYNKETVDLAKKELFNHIIANTPCGLMLTARMTTNYLQLKSIVNQRSNHKMQEWRLLCDYFKTLPMFDIVCK